MKSIYYDIFLSGLTYVLLTYLTFRLMKKRKSKGSDDDGGGTISTTPKIDLPPGVVWPNDPKALAPKEEEVVC
ncbi:hypothetical protein BFP97_15475 [Roseivirga sp. 4D4]|uniref:hypothetical protein n=1 Tax=Roseivirga sp. 4D4 TaxID=1889784 RepID=UPI0008535F65|nr:hypothetical protein [Roseivirga sp. 4D4]OEK02835.1 hypothetical protein BFP97_15475 [Roseivirga sp. 4D4]